MSPICFMFNNKHVIIAMIIAPILAILAWYASDILIAEAPIKVEAGKHYKLAEKANCRWKSGICGLKNKDVELELTIKKLDNDSMGIVKLSSNIALDKVLISFVTDNITTKPKNMQTENGSQFKWRTLSEWQNIPNSRVRIAVQHEGVLFYGDVATIFIEQPSN